MARNFARFDPFAELSALQKQLFSENWLTATRRSMPTTDIYTEDAAQAKFSGGVLRVTVPYKSVPSPRKVAISTEEESA